MQIDHLPAPDVIMTSPLVRALETTQLGVTCAFPSVRTIVLESLRKKVTGTGKNKRNDGGLIKQNFPGFDLNNVDSLDRLGAMYNSPDCVESYDDLWQRVRGSFVYLFENHEDALVVLLIAHCYVIQTIQREITGYDTPPRERKEKVEFFVGEARGYAIVVKGTKG